MLTVPSTFNLRSAACQRLAGQVCGFTVSNEVAPCR